MLAGKILDQLQKRWSGINKRKQIVEFFLFTVIMLVGLCLLSDGDHSPISVDIQHRFD